MFPFFLFENDTKLFYLTVFTAGGFLSQPKPRTNQGSSVKLKMLKFIIKLDYLLFMALTKSLFLYT